MAHELLARLFAAAPRHFPTSPLYGRLGQVVAADERLLALAAEARPGQLPTNLLLAAVHYLLLDDPDHELAAWYPALGGSRYGTGAAAADPGPAFTDFCLTRREEIADLMRRRLVQTNVVKRAMVLRAGLAAVGEHTAGPVALVEVGASAGIHLRFDAYRYAAAGRTWGPQAASVVVATEWRGRATPSDLDRLPAIARRVGVDLNPVDVRDPGARRWLRALVWPENVVQAELLEAALHVVAADPPRMVTGDAVDILPALGTDLPAGMPVVVFHAMTRLHVPAERRGRFDAAVAALGRGRELFHLSFEPGPEDSQVIALRLRRGAPAECPPVTLALADGHVEWMAAARSSG